MDELKIRDRCHVDTNEDGDRFVGVKADTDNAIVYFPLGYSLPEDEGQLRIDIRNLFYVLSAFSKEDRVIETNKFEAPQTVDFPLHAYLTVIEYFLNNDYYVEKEARFITAPRGKIDWAKTIKYQRGLISKQNSLMFTDFTVLSQSPNTQKEITQINRYCVYESFQKLGWLYIPLKPEEPGPHPGIKQSLTILNDEISNTNLDSSRKLFIAMRGMLKYMDDRSSEKQFYFGTDNFETIWEKLIDKVFGIRDKEDYLPRTKWLLDCGKIQDKTPLIPDSIMIYKGKCYVLDAKFYRYGCTGEPDDLPNGSSINKQITYGEFAKRTKRLENDSVFNAFIMPFNQNMNKFGIAERMGNIGEAIGLWRDNDWNYERIQGVVIDTRYLLFNTNPASDSTKQELARQIDRVLARSPLPCL